MSWRDIWRRLWPQIRLFLRQFDGAQGRRDLREMRALQAEDAAREKDPYEIAGRAEIDALLG